MLALEWSRASPGKTVDNFMPVYENADEAPIIAGAFQGRAFIPGVYDPLTKTCVVRDDDTPEQEFYGLKLNPSLSLEWIADKNGHTPLGSLQCGVCSQGKPFYSGRIKCGGRLLSGKVNDDLGGCHVRILGQQFFSNHYEVLCLRTVPFGFSYDEVHPLRAYRPPNKFGNPFKIIPKYTTSAPNQRDVVASYRMSSIQSKPIVRRSTSSFEKTTIILRSNKRLGPPTITWNPVRQNRLEIEASADISRTKRPQKPTINWQRPGSGYRLIRSPSKLKF